MTVVCTIEDCPWKITARAIGDSNIVQVHTFRNVHNHCLEDVALSQPLDFVRQHGIQLTYLQAWQMKEKAKECIYGQPKNYYKLLSWMCERMIATNPGSSVELSYSDDDHFEKLFIAHSISIEGFVRGCQPIIAIDSAHMSGPYGGALFSATAYDANDSMFPLAFGVMSSENYEDWLWFLEKLKIVVGNKEVIIISDRHPTLLRSVPEVFGIENHAYCYCHLKENLVVSCPSITHEGTRVKKMHCNSYIALHMEAHVQVSFYACEASRRVQELERCIGPKIEAKVQENIAKGAVYPVTPFMNGVFGGWQMLGIPCEHATAIIISIGQNVTDFVDDCYKYPMQELIYGGSFSGIETHDMPTVDDDGLVRSITGRLKMATGSAVNVNEQHVSQVMGIPNSGEDLVIVKRTGPPTAHTLSGFWSKTLTICPLDTIWDSDLGVQRNWAKFLLQHLEDALGNIGKSNLLTSEAASCSSSFLYGIFYMPSVIVEVTRPLAAAWSDDVIKRRLAAEISTFGGYGHVDAQEQPQSTPHMQLPSVASTSTAGDDATEVIKPASREFFRPLPIIEHHTKDQPMRPTPVRQPSAEEIEPEDSLVPTPHSPVGMGPSPAPTYSEPLVPQSQAEASLPAKRWVNSMIVAIVSRMMNGQQAPPARAHFFEPSFSVVLSNLKSNATTQVILERCAMYLDPDTLGHDLSSCDMMFIPVCENNHWHVHVVNFAAGRVEILSSLPLRRGNNISAATRRLSMALHKALHAYRIHMDADVSSFVHVQPHLLQQLNGSDCGVLVLKFMEFWNGRP
ncbi:hypothetical protein CK203_046747 [Vitis vinifera]|uniref:Ubiquitin-like protease family profile domain-containing protein n=1 Tax=Vitis vinifera TaxID=29760 RepID=A0A438H1X4_VITVI|nr:hypothetical protein CK203_046747 [Vitis vinifera]